MVPLLQIAGLSKRFGGVLASDNIDLDILHGEIHAVIGPNGAGKTTLIEQLTGAIRPDAGIVKLHGKDITKLPIYSRAKLGITRSFQITSLVMDMTVLDNIALAVQAQNGHSFRFLRPARSIRSIRQAAIATLEQVGLADRANKMAASLSHGEHRQMEIAIALASNADLMLLDEPMAGLGPEESKDLTKLLKGIKKTRTILLIEHDMDAVFALADRISVLVYGRVLATGTPAEIRANDEVRHAYLGEE